MVLECPSCGATLALPDADTFECDYCSKHIIVPSELRPDRTKATENSYELNSIEISRKILSEQLSPKSTNQLEKNKNKRLVTIIVISILIFACASLIPFLFIIGKSVTETQTIIPIGSDDPTQTPTQVPLGSLALIFGSNGDDPGQFDNARSIAVDRQGNIFVADYTTGRINKFDPQGNFLQLIQVPSQSDNPDIYIFGIATDDSGNLFVAVDGSILKYDAVTGNLLLTIPDQWPDIYYQSVVVAPNGNLYSTNGMAGADDVIILSPQGEVLSLWTDLIETVNHDDPALDISLGVNHTGTIFILSPFGKSVYVYNPDGSFNFSFGEEGDLPGQFSLSTGMIAIDENDNVIISDVYRVDLFDANGDFLNESFTIDYNVSEGSMYGMAIDNQDDLYFISSGGKVLKYFIHYP
jgi:hypothetical protein